MLYSELRAASFLFFYLAVLTGTAADVPNFVVIT